MNNIILASQSPRRIKLLKFIAPEFEVIPADIDETAPAVIPLDQIPEFLAVQKAFHISSSHKQSIVIGCDTGAFLDEKMLGKPKDTAQAKEMLLMLSGRSHNVITGCAICYGGKSICFSETTEVHFCPLSSKEIDNYIATKEPMDKAGSYGIQGFDSVFIKGIVGDYFNVMGGCLYHACIMSLKNFLHN